MDFTRWIIIFIALVSIASCKLRIIVPEGGQVVSASGAHDCKEGKTCTIDVVDIFFSETFRAVPSGDYSFIGWKRWKSNKNGFCGGLRAPCSLSTDGFEVLPALLSFLEREEIFYLKPRFKKNDGNLENQSVFTDANADGSGPKRLAKSYHTHPARDFVAVTSFEYHEDGRLWREVFNADGESQVVKEYFYDNGRVDKIVGAAGGGIQFTITYEYSTYQPGRERVSSYTLESSFGQFEVGTQIYVGDSIRPVRADIDSDGDGVADSVRSYEYNGSGLLELETIGPPDFPLASLLTSTNHSYNSRDLRLESETILAPGVGSEKLQFEYEDKPCTAPSVPFEFFGHCL